MLLKLSTKKARCYNARQLKKWHAKNQAVAAYIKTRQQDLKSDSATKSNKDRVTIDLDGIQSLDDFYQRLVAKVKLPTHTAINLDALHDVLLGDVAESLEFQWGSVSEDMTRTSGALEGLKRMLDDLTKARTDTTINYKGYSS